MIIYTSESVSRGHPDKMADQISDAVLDACLRQDKNARVACETLLTRGAIVVAGEIKVNHRIDIDSIARDVVLDIGYNRAELGFDGNACSVFSAIQQQSAEIAAGVDTGGAGDQGMMFGYATNETENYMPLPIAIAHDLTGRINYLVKNNPELGLRPDAKSQVSIVYDKGKPLYIDTIVISAQHDSNLKRDDVEKVLFSHVINHVLDKYSDYKSDKIKYYINPSGSFVLGGPHADAGLTGRKIIVDTYGGFCPHGGGAFSGKDGTKVDRSGAYMARFLAKAIVEAEFASRALVQLAYAIGVEQPVSMYIETYGTGSMGADEIEQKIRDRFDLSPKGMINILGLRNAHYYKSAQNGHFGHSEFAWESSEGSRILSL